MKPSLLFASFLSGLAVLAAVLVTGCASSERMNRLAWDSDSYSAPKASRISGGKYDDAVVKLRTPVGLQDRQVNIWPFCTVNSRYVSILWPFIDWDEFGMAIRPFYNREGNDASILFPLSSWNTVDGDGWALNAYWDPDYYGMFPLFHVGRQPDAFWFAGPFVGDGRSFGVIPLCYFGEDTSIVGPLWWRNSPAEEAFRDCGFFPLFWKFGDGSALLPLYLYDPKRSFLSPLLWMFKDDEEKWASGAYMLLGYWHYEWKAHGFFPFYRVDTTDYEKLNHVLLWWWEHDKATCGLLPFARFDSSRAGALNHTLLWWWEHNKPVSGLFPFAMFDRGKDDAFNYALLQYWQNDWKRHGFFPFYSADTREDDAFNYALLWWWRNNSPSCGLFPFAWFDKDGGFVLPFGGWENKSATHMDGSEETWSEGNILLLGYWGRNAWGAFPFFRGSSAEEDMKYIGPAWWAYDEEEREYGFFPFFRVERSRGETNKSYLFPAYFWEKDEYGSEFDSIPFARKDYEYPSYRALASEHERRYLIYDTFRKTTRRFNGENNRDDYIPYFGYSESFRADRDRLMQEDDLTKEEAVRELDDQVVSTTEERTDSVMPLFEWTRDDDGGRDLGMLLNLLKFKSTKTSYSNTLLWGLLMYAAGEEGKDMFGLPESSERFHVLALFPGYSKKTEYRTNPTFNDGFHNFAATLVREYILRAGFADGSEESEIWSKDLLKLLADMRFIRTSSPAAASDTRQKQEPVIRHIATGGFDVSNDEIFRICGVDRALDGTMTAKEAEEMAKYLIDAVVSHVRDEGEFTDMSYGFLPLFLRLRESVKNAGGEERVTSGQLFTPLTWSDCNDDGTDVRVLLGLLGHYTDQKTRIQHNGAADTEKSASVLTLIRSGRESRAEFKYAYTRMYLQMFATALKDNNGKQSGENPVTAGYWRKYFDSACATVLTQLGVTPEFKDAVARYRDSARTEADKQAMLDAVAKMEDAIFDGNHVETYGGFYPLFFWNEDYMERNGELSGVSKSWFILPLLSGATSNDTGSSLGILCPLIYFGATQIHDTDIPHPGRIIPANANALQASHSIAPVKGETDRYALFLVGSAKETFVQWKPDTDELVSQLYGTLYQMKDEYDVANLTPDELEEQAARKASQFASPADQQRINANIRWATRWNNMFVQVCEVMKKLGMEPPDRKTKLRDSIPPVLEAIAKEHVQTRTISSLNSGWGLTSAAFECKETGDYQTKVLFGLLANNHKIGEKEHRSILGYLYNMDTDGVNTRKFIFPFITTKDAPGFHEWSFLGGLFERSEENGKTGGRIFFFPYGHRPGSTDEED